MAKKATIFSEQVRRLIAESGQSRYRIGSECGIDQSVLSKFMSGQSSLSMRSLDALAEYLGWEVVASRDRKSQPKKTD